MWVPQYLHSVRTAIAAERSFGDDDLLPLPQPIVTYWCPCFLRKAPTALIFPLLLTVFKSSPEILNGDATFMGPINKVVVTTVCEQKRLLSLSNKRLLSLSRNCDRVDRIQKTKE